MGELNQQKHEESQYKITTQNKICPWLFEMIDHGWQRAISESFLQFNRNTYHLDSLIILRKRIDTRNKKDSYTNQKLSYIVFNTLSLCGRMYMNSVQEYSTTWGQMI